MEILKYQSRRFSSAPCLATMLPCWKWKTNNAVFLTGVWITFAFLSVWLGKRWVPLSLHTWVLTYCVWHRGCSTAVLSICTLKLTRVQTLLCLAFSKSFVTGTHPHVPALRRRLYFIPETRPVRQAEPSDQRKVVREFLMWEQDWCLNKHTSFYRYLVDSRWCSSITGTVTKFVAAAFLNHYLFLALCRCSSWSPARVCEEKKRKKKKQKGQRGHLMW